MRSALTTFAALVTLAGCGKGSSGKDDVSLEPEVEVDAAVLQDADGSLTALYDAGSIYTQIVRASASSRIAGASIAIPPRAFDINMDILLEEGSSLTSRKTLSAVGLESAAVLGFAPAVLFMWTYDEDSLKPVTVVLPEPAVTAAEGETPSLAVLYVQNIPGEDTQTLGVVPATDLIVVPGVDGQPGTVRFTTSTFGVWQAVYLDRAAAAKSVAGGGTIVKAGDQAAPGAFAIATSGDGFLEAKTRLTWEAAEAADSYDVLLDRSDASCGQPYKSYSAVTATGLGIELQNGNTYVCVLAVNRAGRTAASNSGLRVKADTVAPATPAKPTHDGPSSVVGITFRWQAVQDAAGGSGISHYELEIYRVAGNELQFSGPVADALSKDTIGEDGHSYMARVRAIDGVGNESAWSAYSAPLAVDTP